MQRLSLFAVALAAACTAFSANAQVVNASFTGTVQSQTGSGFAVNAPVSGSFAYDTGSAAFLNFSIGGLGVSPGYASIAAFSPDRYSALYSAQLSPVQQGGTLNSTFTLDLEASASPWAATNALALLSDVSQLSGNLDLPDSFFRFYTANADGTQVRSLTAQLTGLNVAAAVPEPGTFALMAFGLGAVLLGRRKQRR